MQTQESNTGTTRDSKPRLHTMLTYVTRAQNFSMASHGSFEDRETLQTEMTFDEAGNLLSEAKFLANGKIEEKCTYAFDEKNNLIHETTHHAVEDFEERREIIRNDKGQVLKELKYYPDGSVDTTELALDANGRVCEITVIDDEGTLETRQELTHDSDGNLLSQVKMDADGKAEETFKFGYDDKGRMVKRQTVNHTEGTSSTETITFDDKDRETMSETVDGDGRLVNRTVMEYNAAGKPLRTQSENPLDRSDSRVVTYVYDDRGNCVEETLEGPGEVVLRKTKYAYDGDNRLLSEDTITTDMSSGVRIPHRMRYEYTFY